MTQTSASLIDHVYSSHHENISSCFVSKLSISDHFSICFARKINNKISKDKHMTTSYRCFKHFNENDLLVELAEDIVTFETDQETINGDLEVWSSIILKHLNKHAPIKTKRVKTKRLPDWFTQDIVLMQKQRDNCKRLKQWTEYKTYRNKIRQLIRAAKRKYCSESVANSKDTKRIWAYLRTVNRDIKPSGKQLPEELIIDNEKITKSEDVAHILNTYFTSVADILNGKDSEPHALNTDKIRNFVGNQYHLLFVHGFRFILKSPINMYSKPDACTMESSSSNRSIHSLRALGGRYTEQTKNGFEFGNSISAQIVSILEISYSGLRLDFSEFLE